jgi:hypothetical protein
MMSSKTSCLPVLKSVNTLFGKNDGTPLHVKLSLNFSSVFGRCIIDKVSFYIFNL